MQKLPLRYDWLVSLSSNRWQRATDRTCQRPLPALSTAWNKYLSVLIGSCNFYAMSPLQPSDHAARNRQTGEQTTHWAMLNKGNSNLVALFNISQCVTRSPARRPRTPRSLGCKGPNAGRGDRNAACRRVSSCPFRWLHLVVIGLSDRLYLIDQNNCLLNPKKNQRILIMIIKFHSWISFNDFTPNNLGKQF